MNTAPPDTSPLALCAALIALIPLAVAGLALINTGFGRARSAAHAVVMSAAAAALAIVVFCVWGASLSGVAGSPGHAVLAGGVRWNLCATDPLLLRGLPWLGRPALLLLFELFLCGFAAAIPVSAGAERWRLIAACASTVVFAGVVFPLFAHFAWGNGWLARLGHTFGLGHGFVDLGGSGVAQVTGGLTALALTWLLGPRRGRYTADGLAAAIPGHNIVYVLFGCLLLLPGWLGINGSGAILFAYADAGRVALTAVNTVLCASSALLAALVFTRFRFGKPDASLAANGWLGGLVASSAACAFLTPGISLFVGIVAGFLTTASVEILEVHLAVDDPGGAISVHAVAGVWGLLAAGLFAHLATLAPESSSGQTLAQIVGIATLLGFVLPLSYSLNWLLGRALPYRADPDAERMGMDLHQLGAGAYPDFSVFNDEGNWR
jgi:Amt family ammonium transporter